MIEVCLVSLITSVISFGLPLLRKCSPCPEVELNSGIECPRPPGMYGNYVNVWFPIFTALLDYLELYVDFSLYFLYICVYQIACNFHICKFYFLYREACALLNSFC